MDGLPQGLVGQDVEGIFSDAADAGAKGPFDALHFLDSIEVWIIERNIFFGEIVLHREF